MCGLAVTNMGMSGEMVEFLCPQVIVAFIIDPIYLFTGREIHSCVAVYQGQRIFKSFETHLRT